MDQMYQEAILDHARHPRNFGRLAAPSISHEESNPLCGDVIRMEVRVGADGRIEEVGFTGKGCAISQAAASMLTEEIEGKTLDEVKAIGKAEVLDILGIPISMARMKCALLSLKVLKAGAYGIGDWPGEDEEEAWPTMSR